MDVAERLQGLELVVGRVTAAERHPGARGPSFLLTLDLGPRGGREASFAGAHYARDELVGRQVVCAVAGDEAIVLGAHSHAAGLVLVEPEREVEDGSAVA